MNFHNNYYNAFDPEYGYKDFNFPVSRLGSHTSFQTPNQIAELGQRLNEGVRNVELMPLSTEVMETIPKQHLKEMNRLSKLTDSKISIHAPVVDPAGFDKEGRWSDSTRQENEIHIKSIIERAHELDPDGNIPVNIHSTAGLPAYGFMKPSEEIPEAERPPEAYRMFIVDQDSGRLVQPLEYRKREYIGREVKYTPEQELEMLNTNTWDQEKLKILSYQKEKEEVALRKQYLEQQAQHLMLAEEKERELGKHILTPQERDQLGQIKQQLRLYGEHMKEFDKTIQTGLNEMNHKFQKFHVKPEEPGEKMEFEEKQKELADLNKEYEKQIKEQDRIDKEYRRRRETEVAGLPEQEQGRALERLHQEFSLKMKEAQKIDSNRLLNTFTNMDPPQMFKPVDDFAREKTAETISNAALFAYEKFKDKAPIISIENVYPEMALSRAESLRKAVEETREVFARKLVEKKGLSRDEAQEIAKKSIGVTWDLGHINMLRKSGYSEKEILEETKKIADVVKHVHIADNFGFHDSHLPPGMGDVPIKDMMRELEKKGFSGRAILEAGAFAAHFKESPQPYAFEAMNSPLYQYMTEQPYWGAIRERYAPYFMDHGYFPDQHFKEFYGSGFATIPKELGGQASGDRSRFAETPNQ